MMKLNEILVEGFRLQNRIENPDYNLESRKEAFHRILFSKINSSTNFKSVISCHSNDIELNDE